MGARARRLLGDWNLLSAVAVVVLAIGSAQLVGGAFAAGVTVDEPTQQNRAVAWLDDGWFVPKYFQKDDRPNPESYYSTPFVYGPATAGIGHAVNAAVGNEAWGDVSESTDAYAVRHLTVALIAVLAVVAVGASVRLLTGSAVLGLWGAAALLAVPRFTGHAFFNLKDVPAATGYTLITAALLVALAEQPDAPAGRRRRVAIGAAVGGGIAIAAGTRLSLWLPFAVALGSYAALRLGQWRLGGIVRYRGTDVAVAVGASAGFLAIAALYPNVAVTPLEMLVESVSNSADYSYGGETLTAGRLLSEHPPLWYLPAWIGGTYPLLLGLLALLGTGAGLRALARARASIWRRRDLGLLLVLEQAVMLPVAVLVNGGLMYSGLRQHLYVLPALTILAGFGAWRLLRWTRSRRSSRAWGALAVGVLCLALIVPMAAQTLLFPYNYTYLNPVAAIGGIDGRWETDYWEASVPEALSHVPLNVDLRCSSHLENPVTPENEVDLGECDGDQYEAAADERATDVAAESLRGPRSVWVIGRKRSINRPPPYCEEADDVTRWMWGERVTMAYVLRCDPRRTPPPD
jgi:hypothetical protein